MARRSSRPSNARRAASTRPAVVKDKYKNGVRVLKGRFCNKRTAPSCKLHLGHKGKCDTRDIEEVEYEPRKVLSQRYTESGALEYRIAWKGWSNADATWAPASGRHQVGHLDIVRAWVTKQRSKQRSQRRA